MNFQDLALNEAVSLGMQSANAVMGGVEFEGGFWQGVFYCLSSRLSSRVLMKLVQKKGINNIQTLKDETLKINFEDYFSSSDTILVTSTIHFCKYLNNTMMASQVVKDGICDRQRQVFSSRSYVDKENPDFVIHIHLDRDEAIWYLDFSAQSLCKRHYRVQNTPVYLQEHTSSAVLMRSGYFKREPSVLLDPFCGSGTILIEAALALSDTAPGIINTTRYAFLKYKEFDNVRYTELVKELKDRSDEGKKRLREKGVLLYGFDSDEKCIDAAVKNADAAGVSEFISFRKKSLDKLTAEDFPCEKSGFLVTDPPYDSRVKVENVDYIYKLLGDFILDKLSSWNVSILSARSDLLSYVNLTPERTNTIMNGSLKCTLAHYYVFSEKERLDFEKRRKEKEELLYSQPLSKTAQMIYNRLEKNKKSLSKFLCDNNITCYRLYDADMNEYSAAVDVYEDKYIVLQEYQKGENVSSEDAKRRLEEIKLSLIKLYKLPANSIFVKTRSVQKGANQYNKLSSENQNYIVHENGLKFLVNFTDYLDTGLFLDHRYIRSYIRQSAKDKKFLNLFCYTGSATVYAMAGGALSSVSVDASEKYLSVARENLDINFLNKHNCFFRKQDCFEYLKSLGLSEKFDLIFLDPPTFSNNKSRGVFDIQKDHTGLIKLCLSHLSDDGELIFSTNLRTFKLDENINTLAEVEDISQRTIDEDFRDKKIHKVFLLHKKEIKNRSIKDIAQEINSFKKKVFSGGKALEK